MSQYGQVNRQNALLEEQRRRERQRMMGAVIGLGVGALAGPAVIPGMGAVAGAAYGAQAGGAFASGDPTGVAMAGLGAAAAGQAGSDRAANLQAGMGVANMLRQGMASGAEPNPAFTGGIPAPLTEPERQRNLTRGAFASVAEGGKPEIGIQGLLALQQQDAAQAAAAATQALTLRGQNITLAGQENTATIAEKANQNARDIAAERRIATNANAAANREAAADLAAQEAELRRELQRDRLLQEGESPGEFMVRLAQQQIDFAAGVPGVKPLTEAELQAMVKMERLDPLRAQMGNNPQTPMFNPQGKRAAPKVDVEKVTQDANEAIRRGADPAVVREKYKKLTGIDLP